MMTVPAPRLFQLPIRTTSHRATSSKSSKNGMSRSSLNFWESEADAPERRSVVKRSEEHTSELQSRLHLVCRLLLEKKKPRHSRTTDTRDRTRITHPHTIIQ